MTSNLITRLGARALTGAFHKGLATAFVLVLLNVPLARSAPPDEQTKAMIDAAIAQERKGPERVRKLYTVELTSLLMNERFEELESIINQIEMAAQRDPTLEFEYHAVFDSVDPTDSNLLASLDRWVKLRPSASSHTARGVYLGKRAFVVRGYRMARETPALNFELMEIVVNQAVQDLKKAISLDPGFIPAYTQLITVSKLSGGREVDAFQLVNSISRLKPSNLGPREAFLETLEPRWGGSHEAMFRFAESAAKDAKHNPMLWLLTGRVYLDLVRSRQSDNPEQDIKDLTEGLKYGESNILLELRGDAYWRHKNYPDAIADYSKCVSNNPNGYNNCKERLKTLTDWQERVRKFQQKSN